MTNYIHQSRNDMILTCFAIELLDTSDWQLTHHSLVRNTVSKTFKTILHKANENWKRAKVLYVRINLMKRAAEAGNSTLVGMAELLL